ncbi:DMT family transporter [Tianweitania sp. BSSL-BM11]|uniref:DMT family transporter n=1 Tax=Tianweitania aestuarii TaxID=2814886 RepID=A0ABS5RZP0_9HYPH|nr:DMT family transporter [Tianweitania aestuarii]MBS9721679.1 DMT family transporter [Tianweitania aestuarii]
MGAWTKQLRTTDATAAGVIIMLVGLFLFAINDAMGKWLVASFSVGQILLVRSIGAFLILGPMLVARDSVQAVFRPEKPALQALRVLASAADVGFFYAAVAYLPLADALTFYMAGPIYVAALSHFFLGERSGWKRWTAIFVGFIGVIIVLRPSSASLTWPSLFAVMGSFSLAVQLILSRLLRNTSDSVLVTWQTVGVLIIGVTLSANAWTTPDLTSLIAMLMLGVVASIAHMMMTRSMKLASASLLAPLQYTLLLWAIILGVIFFDELPDLQVILGSVIIIVAGLFIFHRKKVVGAPVKPETVDRV